MQVKAYRYYIGPWVWNDQGEGQWEAPAGTVGLLDLRAVSSCGKRGGTPEGVAFFAVDGVLPAPYFEVAYGYLKWTGASETMKNEINARLGFKPAGTNLEEILWDIFTVGADPTGKNRLKPLMPNANSVLELHLGGHSLIRSTIFRFGEHSHTAKIRETLQHDYRALRNEFVENKHYLRILDFWREKYGVSDTDQFIPDDLPKEKPLPHQTTITESFTAADSDTLTADLVWTERAGDWDIVSNQAKGGSDNVVALAKAEANALSSSDHYAQANSFSTRSGTQLYHAMVVRATSGADGSTSSYLCRYLQDNSQPGGVASQVSKRVNGTNTSLGLNSNNGSPTTLKGEANGSSITAYYDGVSKTSVTDTAITSGTIVGIYGFNDSGNRAIMDNFQAADLAAAPAQVYPRLMGLMGVG